MIWHFSFHYKHRLYWMDQSEFNFLWQTINKTKLLPEWSSTFYMLFLFCFHPRQAVDFYWYTVMLVLNYLSRNKMYILFKCQILYTCNNTSIDVMWYLEHWYSKNNQAMSTKKTILFLALIIKFWNR